MAIRVIHVGVGGRGKWPIWVFKERKDFKSVALVDIDPEALEMARKETGLGIEACFENMEDALRNVEADAVIVITPPQLHTKQCLTAVKNNKHVLVEKPFTLSLQEATEIVREADSKNVKVTVAQNIRHKPVYTTLARLIKEEIYGKPFFGLMVVFDWRPKVHHSGKVRHSYLWERGIHDLDTLRGVLNSEALYVSGYSFNPSWSPYEHGAGCCACVKFKNEVILQYIATFSAHSGSNSLRVECEEGSLEIKEDKIYVHKPGVEEVEVLTPNSGHSPENLILDGFYQYITEDVEPPFGGHENLKTVALVEAVGISSDKLKVINLEEIHKDLPTRTHRK